jgi:hypothetical protein
MSPERTLWCWYLAGALAALAWKFLAYYRVGRRSGRDFLEIADEWVFEQSPENAVSWIATVLVVWCAGVLFIEDLALAWVAWIRQIPAHPAFAALFGYLMEYGAPNAFKWILSMTPWGAAEKGGG